MTTELLNKLLSLSLRQWIGAIRLKTITFVKMKNNNQFANMIRWTARIIGSAIVAFTILFGIGYLIEGFGKPSSGTFNTILIITFALWGIGLAGLIFALWKEGRGGIISLVSLIIFIALVAVKPNPDSSFSYVLFIFLIPSVLYIYYWWLKKKSLGNVS